MRSLNGNTGGYMHLLPFRVVHHSTPKPEPVTLPELSQEEIQAKREAGRKFKEELHKRLAKKSK